MGKLFKFLKEGLEDAISYEKGLSKKSKVKKLKIENSVVLQKDVKDHKKELNRRSLKIG